MKILIADNHTIVRKGLIELLRDQFLTAEIHEVTNGTDVIAKMENHIWDLILLDISMPGNGIDTLKKLRSGGIITPILVLSMQPEEDYAIRLLKAGASGYINKDTAADELIMAVQKVVAGGKYISASVAGNENGLL